VMSLRPSNAGRGENLRKNGWLTKLAGVMVVCGFMGLTGQALAAGAMKAESLPSSGDPEVNAEPKGQILVTFVELGSVRCVPCKAMQPIMAEIEKEYAGQVKVVFHDVWTQEGRPFAEQYQIHGIPTQVFLDKEGKEFFRHVGFFPKVEIVKVLQSRGVK
jgi:thioredoxin 1